MPHFMDRHDVGGASAEEVQQAHVMDLQAGARHGVSFLSYFWDSVNGAVFCFAEAPSSDSMLAVHEESHGLVPAEIISVTEDNVLRFFGRISDPPTANEADNPFRTIVFTDLEGSTSLLERLGEAGYMLALTEHDLIVRRALVQWRGREVKHTGDGFLISFEETSNALRFSNHIEDAFEARLVDADATELRVRVGMSAGEPVDHNDDIFGTAVTLASRLCDAARPGHALVSEVVHDLGLEAGFRFEQLDPVRLKGFSEPVPVFELAGGAG